MKFRWRQVSFGARLRTKRRKALRCVKVDLSPPCIAAKMEESESREMSPRAAYIEKLRRIASGEKGMRRAFLLAKAHAAEAESDDQFCKRMRVREVTDTPEVTSNGRSPSNGGPPCSPDTLPAFSNGVAPAHSALAVAHSARHG